MASILDRYGIKEVADVTFYDIDSTGNPSVPVLYLDTLKVSTIEQTAETADAKGGKGNATLISWDYGKEINVTLEDALFSAKSLAIMFGNGSVKTVTPASSSDINGHPVIMKTETFVATGTSLPSLDTTTKLATADASGWHYLYEGPNGQKYNKHNPKFYDEKGNFITSNGSFTVGKTYFCSYDLWIAGDSGTTTNSVIEISANSFPGTYYITGDTFARAEVNGKDEFFQFIIPKAKVTSENTITLEAEGDPSVFNMNLKVLRPADGVMMKLVQYNLDGSDVVAVTATNTSTLIHNHTLSTTMSGRSINGLTGNGNGDGSSTSGLTSDDGNR